MPLQTSCTHTLKLLQEGSSEGDAGTQLSLPDFAQLEPAALGCSSSWSLPEAQTSQLRAPQPHAVSPRLLLAGGLRVDSTSSARFPGGARLRHRHPAAEKSRSSLSAARKLPRGDRGHWRVDPRTDQKGSRKGPRDGCRTQRGYVEFPVD